MNFLATNTHRGTILWLLLLPLFPSLAAVSGPSTSDAASWPLAREPHGSCCAGVAGCLSQGRHYTHGTARVGALNAPRRSAGADDPEPGDDLPHDGRR